MTLQVQEAQTRVKRGLLIEGEWVEGLGGSAVVLDKYSGQPCAEVMLPSREQVATAVAAANKAFRASSLGPYQRGQILDKVARIIEERTDRLQKLLTTEAGFTVQDALGEIQRSIATLKLSAQEARGFCGHVVPLEGASGQDGRLGLTLRTPLGVVCAITPFNAPLNTVVHKVGPAIAAGNAVILKPSPHTPIIACELADAFTEAGLPAAMLSVVHGGEETVRWLQEEEAVHFFAFTGSTEVGRAIQRGAGLRRTQMELGSIAFSVLCDDANLDVALDKVVKAAYRKAGQVCTSIQMLLVHRSIFETVQQRLTEAISELQYGDPALDSTFVGPVISDESATRIMAWIDEAVAKGASCLVGGVRSGNVVAPTLMVNVDQSMHLGCQEVFGPVMSVIPFDTVDEAIDRINATPFGLATGVFTNRLADAFKFARRLVVGGVHINETSSSRVDLMPYGGSKDSGFGREGPHYAVREMSEERLLTIVADVN